MATIERSRDQFRHILSSRDLVGRSRHCDLRIEKNFVSNEHAVLQWNGERWDLRDLGSRNGTFLDGERIEPGVLVPLREGVSFEFGATEESWRLLDVSAPTPLARAEDGRAEVLGDDGLLALPDPENPEVTVFLRHGAIWVAERGDTEEAVTDRSLVVAGDRRWMLRLPETLVSTEGVSLKPPSAEEKLALRFRVSRDEEHVELTAHEGERELDLGARAHHHVLLVLARQRLRDQSDESLPETSRGWLYQDDVARMLAIDEPRVNVDIYRARKQLAKAGALAPVAVVERRAGTRQLRIGTGRIEIVSL